ncbi:MAG: nucleotidyltransferase family protein [Candidatus Heimdallarchaeota archaeon]|nr:nucleotidyltransferase family protein [Candidatus Heimdallarchaeota archaeon]MCK5047766.1 nucleotidyltransferase family protein [Candidatus Heimdallarchaeota archaeon]
MDQIEKVTAIILAGGRGTRLRSVTGTELPKGLTEIKGKSILEWQFEWLSIYGIKHVILAIGYLAEVIEERFGSSYRTDNGVEIKLDYSVETEKLGSGGAISFAKRFVQNETFLIVNGDILTNYNLLEMFSVHKKHGKLATMALSQMRSPYGVVNFNKETGQITNFVEKPLLDTYIHAGVDFVETKALDRFPEKGQMEDTIFIEMSQEQNFFSYCLKKTDYWQSIDTHKDYETANNNWKGL